MHATNHDDHEPAARWLAAMAGVLWFALGVLGLVVVTPRALSAAYVEAAEAEGAAAGSSRAAVAATLAVMGQRAAPAARPAVELRVEIDGWTLPECAPREPVLPEPRGDEPQEESFASAAAASDSDRDAARAAVALRRPDRAVDACWLLIAPCRAPPRSRAADGPRVWSAAVTAGRS